MENKLKIKTWRDPYDRGFFITKPKEIEINPGPTVLVGCNGAGKSTLLHNIHEELKKEKIPCHLYDNCKDGGTGSIGEMITGGDMALGISLWTSSEGEGIKININKESALYREFFNSGYYKNNSYRFSRIFRNEEEEIQTNVRVLMYDATDSGLSIDNVIELKNMFSILIKEAEKCGVELYIIISANEYELCNGEQCFDVTTGKYRTFKTYNSFKKFIISSRIKKEKRIEKSLRWCEKQREKEEKGYYKLKESIENKKQKYIEKVGRELTWSENHMYEDTLNDYLHSCRFFVLKEEEE